MKDYDAIDFHNIHIVDNGTFYIEYSDYYESYNDEGRIHCYCLIVIMSCLIKLEPHIAN